MAIIARCRNLSRFNSTEDLEVASDHEFTFGSAIEPQRKGVIRFDRALHMAAYFCRPDVLVNTSVFLR